MRSARHGRFTHFSASADTLTLPKGHVLDFGDTVDVLDGRQTYFGKQMKNWAEHEAVEKESKPQAAAIGIIGGVDSPTSVYLTSKLAPHVSRLAAEALGELRVYQLRANTPEAFTNPSCFLFPWIIRILGKRRMVYCLCEIDGERNDRHGGQYCSETGSS